MVDREKVIKGLECCQYSSKSHCDSCPFAYEGMCGTNDCTSDLASEAIVLLKEQEPVAPVMVPHSRGIAWNCGACGTEIAVIRDTVSADWQKNSVRFCQRCGRSVKW